MLVARCPRITTDNPVRVVTEYSDPALEGTTVMFSCPTGLTLTGSNSSTCMEGGEWEPDLKETKCKGGYVAIGSYSLKFYQTEL